MSRSARVIVAGAGALGLSTALTLADAGCQVSVCDPSDRSQASSVAAGMLAPVFEVALDAETTGDLDLLLAARNLWPGLAARIGIAIDRSGAVAAGSEAWLADIRTRLAGLGFGGSELSRQALEDLAPGISPCLEAVLMREDWRIEPRPALAALRTAAEAAGVEFRPWTASGRGGADWLVVATGADPGLRHVAPELNRIVPIKGQILRFSDRRGGGVSLRGEHAYAAPGADGMAVGATMEPGRNDTTIDPVALQPLVDAAGSMFPDLAEATFSASAGVRAATPDGLPMAGPSRTNGVILAVGARRNGWLLAPLVAETVTACVMGRESGPYAARLDPSRFEQRAR